MRDLLTGIIVILIGGIVLTVAIILPFAFLVKLHDGFVAALRGLRLIHSESEPPRWRQFLSKWEERHSQLVSIFVVSAIAFLIAAGAWGSYTADGSDLKQFAKSALFIGLSLLGAPPWWFWFVVASAFLWAWSYRRNRIRQEAIIGLLLEIRESLQGKH